MIEYSEMTSQQWLDHVEEMNEKARRNGGLVDVSNANILRGFGINDAKMESGVSARQRYIDKINTPPKSESTLFKEYREDNIRRILGGIAPYSTPENGGVES